MKITNAIILAAGEGKRLRPLTLTTPKPLLKINNKPIIEYTIELLQSKGIYEIEIVVGYLKEQFEYLTSKYDNIVLIENPEYEYSNNISSIFYASDYLKNTVILDGDILIKTPEILLNDINASMYTCFYSDQRLSEWFVNLNNENKIIFCHREGADRGYVIRSIVYLTKSDSSKLRDAIVDDFVNKNLASNYYDDVLLFTHKDQFELYCHKIKQSDVIEFDELNEYLDYLFEIGGKNA